MNKFIVLVPMLAILVACDLGTNPSAGNGQGNTAIQLIATDFYARRPTEYTWPAASQSSSQDSSALLTKNYYLVIDGSGSMLDSGCSGNLNKIDAAKLAVNQFVDNIPTEANVGLLVFDTQGIGERVPLGENHVAVKQQVQSISANKGTPLLSAISAAYQAITIQAEKQFGYGEYHLIVVTDGEANDGQDPSSIVEKILRESPVTIHTIGFCIGSGHSLNLPGITHYRAANNPEELFAGLQNVLAESSEYVAEDFNEAKNTQ